MGSKNIWLYYIEDSYLFDKMSDNNKEASNEDINFEGEEVENVLEEGGEVGTEEEEEEEEEAEADVESSNKTIQFNQNNVTVSSTDEGNEDLQFSANSDITNAEGELGGVLSVEEDIYEEDTSKIFQDDLVYLKDLEAQLLSNYPVSKQGLLYIQRDVQEEAQRILEMRKYTFQKHQQFEKGFDYAILEEIFQGAYPSHWVLPIVLDKHKIYTHLEERRGRGEEEGEGEEDEEKDLYIVESLESEEGLQKENQVLQHEKLKTILHKTSLFSEESRIPFKNYQQLFYHIQEPYVTLPPSEENKSGYFTHLHARAGAGTLVLRYHDLENSHWKTRMADSDSLTFRDRLDEETGKIVGVAPFALTKADDIQIVGFMVLSKKRSERPTLLQDLVLSSKITKIEQTGDFVKITSPKHGITSKMKIYIQGSNSIPNIDGLKPHQKIQIVDENTLSFKTSMRLTKDGDFGEIYSMNKLTFDKYKIQYQDAYDDYSTVFQFSSYSDGSESDDHHKAYLFPDIDFGKGEAMGEAFRKILLRVMPSLEKIIEMEADAIAQVYTIPDIDTILTKYGIRVNDLKKNEMEFIKTILLANLKKMRLQEEIFKREALPVFHLKNKDAFQNKNFILANIYLTNPEVTKYYGEYDHIDKPEDSISLRLEWLLYQKDHGTIFFSEMMKMNYPLFQQIHNRKYVDEMVQKYGQFEANTSKQFQKEKNMEEQLRTKATSKKNRNGPGSSSCCELFRFELAKEEDLGDLSIEELGVADGTLAFVGGREIWIWNEGEQIWNKADRVPKYKTIQYLCMFQNKDLEEIDLETLDSIYRKDMGCHSKLYIRQQERLEQFTEIHRNFQDLQAYMEKDTYMELFQSQIDAMVYRYYSEGTKVAEEKKTEAEAEAEEEAEAEAKAEEDMKTEAPRQKDALDQLLQKIYLLKDVDLQRNYVYQLIDKDGLLIGDDIYSKRFYRKMDLCGHYLFLKKINNTSDEKKRSVLYSSMLTKYSDEGEAEGSLHTCKNCGLELGDTDRDEVMGYTESGQQIRVHEKWDTEEHAVEEQTMEDVVIDTRFQMIDCDSKEFRKFFLEKGFPSDVLNKIYTICVFVQKNLCSKAGIQLYHGDLVNIIMDSLQKINSMQSYEDYVVKEKKRLEVEKGYKTHMLEKMAAGKEFLPGYQNYNKVYFASVLAARVLISIQTAVPPYEHNAKMSPCTFISFDGIHGIQYMACILSKMKIVQGRDDDLVPEFMEFVKQHYQDFRKTTMIHELYLKKEKYILEFSQKMGIGKEGREKGVGVDQYVYEEVSSLPERESLIQEMKSGSREKKDAVTLQWLNRIGYLNQEMRKGMMRVLEETQMRDVNPESGMGINPIEKACCDEILDGSYPGYIQFYEDHATDLPLSIRVMMDELTQLYKMRYLFSRLPVFHRSFIKTDVNGTNVIENTIVYREEEDGGEAAITNLFLQYVDEEGPLWGTLREYIGSGADRKDIRTGKLYEKLKEKKYTKAEYEKLLAKVGEMRMQSLNTYQYAIYGLQIMLQIKKDVEVEKERQIQKLIQSLTTLLGRRDDKDFIEKYSKILSNIGFYQSYMKEKDEKKIKNLGGGETLSEADKKQGQVQKKRRNIMHEKMMMHIRLQYLKKCYNDYLRKHLSIIKNNMSRVKEIQDSTEEGFLPFAEEFVSRDIQSFILEKYASFEDFLDPTVKSYFDGVSLKNDATMVHSIYAEDDFYDSEYKDIRKFADFNFHDAANIVHYLFVKELNDLIVCVPKSTVQKGGANGNGASEEDDEEDIIDASAGDEEDEMDLPMANMVSTNSQMCKYRALFIIYILDMIYEDVEMLDLCTEDLEAIQSRRNFGYLKELEFTLDPEREGSLISRQLQFSLYGRATGSAVPQEGAEEAVDEKAEVATESLEEAMEVMRQKYETEYGEPMTEDMAEDYKQKYLEELYNKADEQEDVMMDRGEGGDYGDLGPNEFEEGDYGQEEMAFIAEQEA